MKIKEKMTKEEKTAKVKKILKGSALVAGGIFLGAGGALYFVRGVLTGKIGDKEATLKFERLEDGSCHVDIIDNVPLLSHVFNMDPNFANEIADLIKRGE